jgi:nicotinate-nucleotide adenylyltransferase
VAGEARQTTGALSRADRAPRGELRSPTFGHLLAASDAHEALDLDRLVFIPAAVQPLKVDRTTASAEQRFAMTKMLAASDPRFDVDAIEIDRGGLSLHGRYAHGIEAPLAVGGALLAGRSGHRVVRSRSGASRNGSFSSRPSSCCSGPATSPADPAGRDALSRDAARRRLVDRDSPAGEGGKSVRGFVPDAVAEFIAAERLYR